MEKKRKNVCGGNLSKISRKKDKKERKKERNCL